MTWIIHQQRSGYKVEEKLYLGVREQKRLNTTDLDYTPMTGKKWIRKDFKGDDRDLIEVLSRHLPGGTEENYETSVRIASVPAEIRTEHIPNTSLERYRYTNLLGKTLVTCSETSTHATWVIIH
jgi:hypothetical protein